MSSQRNYVEPLRKSDDSICEATYRWPDSDHELVFQRARWHYASGGSDLGFRFVWRIIDGKTFSHRGGARIPTVKVLFRLLADAASELFWLNVDG